MPAFIPVRVPEASMVTLALLLFHVPPGVASLKVITVPTHSDEAPWTGSGVGFTVITFVTTQLPTVYDIVTVPVVCVLLAVTIPEPLTVAIIPLLLLHVPPGVASLRVVV